MHHSSETVLFSPRRIDAGEYGFNKAAGVSAIGTNAGDNGASAAR
jgi:hypothetical protein